MVHLRHNPLSPHQERRPPPKTRPFLCAERAPRNFFSPLDPNGKRGRSLPGWLETHWWVLEEGADFSSCSSFPNDFRPPPFPFSSVPPATSGLPTRAPPSACPVAAGPEALLWLREAVLTQPRPPDRWWGWGSRRCSSPLLALGASSRTGPCTPPRTSPRHRLNLGERHRSRGVFPGPSETGVLQGWRPLVALWKD